MAADPGSDDRLVVGRIMKAHGIRGEVSVDVLSDAPGRFAPGAHLRCGHLDLTVESTRPHQQRLLVKFEQVLTRTIAETLRGKELTVAAEEAAPLDDWSFYPHELEGFAVVDEEGAALGRFTAVVENPANDLWVVEARGKQVLVPAVRAIVLSVDKQARTIVLRPPGGLF